MLRKEHLTSKGLLDTLSIKASLNLGLPDVLKKTFPNIVPKARPIVEFKGIIDPQWLAGFADGESCFFVEKSVSKTNKSGYLIRLKVILSQNVRDVALLNSIKNYVNCGEVIIDSRGLSHFIVRKKSDIANTILPFFAKYPLHSSKLADYNDFCLVAKIIDSKAHLTNEGLEQIDRIKRGMNRGRLH